MNNIFASPRPPRQLVHYSSVNVAMRCYHTRYLRVADRCGVNHYALALVTESLPCCPNLSHMVRQSSAARLNSRAAFLRTREDASAMASQDLVKFVGRCCAQKPNRPTLCQVALKYNGEADDVQAFLRSERVPPRKGRVRSENARTPNSPRLPDGLAIRAAQLRALARRGRGLPVRTGGSP